MLEKYVSEILDAIVDLFPDNWERFVLWGNIKAESCTFCFVVRSPDYPNYADILALRRDNVFSLSQDSKAKKKVFSICRKAQEQAHGDEWGWAEPWKNFTLAVDVTGEDTVHFTVEYGYDDLPIGPPDGWEAKYMI